MAEVLFVILVVVLLVVGGTVALAALAVHAVVASNRVVAGRPSPAPLSWLVAPELPARLHRRVRAAMSLVATGVSSRGDELGLGEVVGQLQDRAVELDHQLVLARRHRGAPRRRMLHELQSEVTELEALAERTTRMSRAWLDDRWSGDRLQPVRDRLDLLEEALRELDGVDIGRAVLDADRGTPSQ